VTDDERDPRVQRESFFWIECTICGPDSEPTPPRFTSEIALWDRLMRPSIDDWIRLDDGRILCPIHRKIAECDLDGHEMTPWTEHPLDEDLDWRYCRRCGSQFEQRIAITQSRAGR
jgi:hypothetical protein